MSTQKMMAQKQTHTNMFSNMKEMLKLMQVRRRFIFLTILEIFRGFWLINGEAWGLKWLADGCITKDSRLFWLGISIIVVTVLVSVLAVFFIESNSMKIAVKTKSDLRKRLIRASLSADITDFYNFHSGDLLYRLNNNVNDVVALYRSFYFFVGSFGKVVGSLLVGFVLSWHLSIIIMLLGLLKIWADKTVIRSLEDVIRKIKVFEADLVKEVLEYIKGSIFFRMFGSENKIFRMFITTNTRFADENLKEARVSAKLTMISKLSEFVTILTVLSIGSIFVVKGRMSIGALTAFIALYDNLINPYKFIGNFLKDYKIYNVSYGRIHEIIQMNREKHENSGKLSAGQATFPPDKQFSLHIEHLFYKYSTGSLILEDICLEARSGQITYIVGKSGIGKTTLFKILMGFNHPNKGEIYITVGGERQPAESGLFTYVSQQIFLFSGTVKENVALANDSIDEERLIQAAKDAGIHDFISTLPHGYETAIIDGGKQFSGGQKCRIALARAFYRPTPILLLDEVFASLDNNTIELVQKSLKNLCRDNHCILMISHRHEWINPEAPVIEIK